jgi:hypothetical protein
VSRVVTHPTDSTTFFVVRSGFGSGKVYRTTNAGTSWTDVSGDLPDIPHSDLFIDPLSTDRYYVANDFGVYRSTNAGVSWVREGTGMPYVVATDFDFFSYMGTRILRVATHGRSVFEASLPVDFSVTPGSLAFGSVEVDSSEDGLLTVVNNGVGDLMIDSAISTHPAFTVSPLSHTITSGDSATFTVTFLSDSLGVRSGQLIFYHSMASSPDSVAISGTGVVPVNVVKLRDMDDDTSTAGDLVSIPWGLTLYAGSILSGNIVAQGGTGSISAIVASGGQYIACEADSGAGWRRINGGGALCDTFFVDNSPVTDTFVNYRKNSLLVRKYRDADSNVTTTADALPKFWYMDVHRDSVNGSVYAGIHDSVAVLDDVPGGTYVVTESDSSGWIRLGHILNGTPVTDTGASVMVVIDGGEQVTLHFVNLPPQYPLFSAAPSIDFGSVQVGYQKIDSLSINNFGYYPLKIDSVLFDDPAFSSLTDTMIVPDFDSSRFYVTFLPDTLGPVSGNLVFHHSGTGSPDTVGLSGIGLNTYQSVIYSGWNLISLPLVSQDSLVSVLYPGAVTNAFSFSGGSYQSGSTMTAGGGYFLKVAGDETVTLNGTPLEIDTLDVEEGWNMVGSIADTVPVSMVISDPGGLVTSAFFGFSGGYFNADQIQPGRGYWVKVSQAGKLILSTSTGMNPDARIRLTDRSAEPPAPPESSVGGISTDTPSAFALFQNHPNPFNPSTRIVFDLPRETGVSLKIFTVMGQEIFTLVDGLRSAGRLEVHWDAANWPSGVYYFRLQAGEYSETRKLLLLR